MKAIFDERQLRHTPERYFRRGAYMPHPEQAERAILIRDMLIKNEFPIEKPRDFGDGPIKAVHDPDYVDFWKDAYQRWRAEAPDRASGAGSAWEYRGDSKRQRRRAEAWMRRPGRAAAREQTMRRRARERERTQIAER